MASWPMQRTKTEKVMTMNILADKEEFQRWASHPGTLAFRDYLTRKVGQMAGAWMRGAAFSPEEQAQAVLMSSLLDLNHTHIASEYGIEVADEE